MPVGKLADVTNERAAIFGIRSHRICAELKVESVAVRTVGSHNAVNIYFVIFSVGNQNSHAVFTVGVNFKIFVQSNFISQAVNAYSDSGVTLRQNVCALNYSVVRAVNVQAYTQRRIIVAVDILSVLPCGKILSVHKIYVVPVN